MRNFNSWRLWFVIAALASLMLFVNGCSAVKFETGTGWNGPCRHCGCSLNDKRVKTN